VLPVFIQRVALEALPPYLRAVTILDPSGEPVADTLNAVADLAALRRRRRRNRILAAAAAAVLLAVALWAVYVNGPALLGERVQRALHPPAIENVHVARDPAATDANAFRFEVTLYNPSNAATFRWRICWTYVKTEDWYAEEMYKKSGGSPEFEVFIERHKARVCDAWRPWSPGP